MEQEQVDELIISPDFVHDKDSHADKRTEFFLEQYRIYLQIFNSTSDHRHKSNEFFLGLNTAIMGIMGYIETKDVPHAPIIFLLAPLVGIAICFCWYRLIISWSRLNSAKFKVIHALEKKLPAILFETEWKILKKGRGGHRYRPLSQIEKYIPTIFIALYIIILLVNFPIYKLLGF